MKAAQDIIIKPIITEESMTGIMMKKYTFKVAKDAGKIEIKKAVESLFKVNVTSVRTVNVAGKVKRFGRNYGKRQNWKKAYITLKEGQTVDFFEV